MYVYRKFIVSLLQDYGKKLIIIFVEVYRLIIAKLYNTSNFWEDTTSIDRNLFTVVLFLENSSGLYGMKDRYRTITLLTVENSSDPYGKKLLITLFIYNLSDSPKSRYPSLPIIGSELGK
jgi:hypothetical protein